MSRGRPENFKKLSVQNGSEKIKLFVPFERVEKGEIYFYAINYIVELCITFIPSRNSFKTCNLVVGTIVSGCSVVFCENFIFITRK